MVLLHDVVHPFVTVGLSREVVAAAARSGAAMAARCPPEYVYQQTSPRLVRLTPSDSLWISHKPHAFRRDVLQAVLDAAGAVEVGVTELAARLGHPIEIVASPPWNIKITTREDWRLARAIEEFISSASRARSSRSSATRPSRGAKFKGPAGRSLRP